MEPKCLRGMETGSMLPGEDPDFSNMASLCHQYQVTIDRENVKRNATILGVSISHHESSPTLSGFQVQPSEVHVLLPHSKQGQLVGSKLRNPQHERGGEPFIYPSCNAYTLYPAHL